MSRVAEPFPPPRFVFLELNKRCNLRCQHCDYWLRKDDHRESSTQHGKLKASEHVARFGPMRPPGRVAEIPAGIRALVG